MDVNPGDRAASCAGMMEPVGTLQKHGEFFILQRCVKCGFERNNKMGKGDSFEEAVKISKKADLK